MSSSTRPSRAGLEVVVGRDLRQDVLPGPGDVGLVAVRPAEVPRRRPSSTRRRAGRRASAARPIRSGLTAAQTSTNGWPTTSTCSPTGDAAIRSAIRLSFEPGTRWSTSTPTRRSGPGPKSRRWLGEVVDAAEVLDDHALDPQVVAPDLLDQLGVVAALDEDPAGPGDPGPCVVRRRPSRRPCGSAWRARRTRTGAVRITGLPSSRKPGPSGKVRRLPRRSSRVSVCRSRSTATISPHQSVVTSSTTAPSSAGASTARPRLGARQSVARTSVP